jgi:benzoate-CoA ligase
MSLEGIELRPWEPGFTLPEQFNMVSLLLDRHLGPESAGQPVIHFEGKSVTYGELGQLANRVGNGLASLGVSPGDRVVIMLYDSPDFMAVFLGAMKIGAVPVPVNILAMAKDLAYFVTDSGAAAVVIEPDLLSKLESVQDQCTELKHVLVRGPEAGKHTSLEKLAAEASPELAAYPTKALDHSYWLYTSGTTGQPKGVVHLHKDLVYAVETWGRHVMDFQAEDRVYCVSKLFFSYGLNNGLYLPLYFGASVILCQDRPVPETVLKTIADYKPTVFFSVPTSYAQVLNYLEESGEQPDISSLRACISAGEALPAPLFKRWKDRFGLDILDGLGSSEVSFIYFCNRPGAVRPGSSGTLLPGYQAKIADELGNELSTGETGDLWVKSQTLAKEYWNKPEKTAETFRDGWMKTGDRGHIDEDGYFHYFGRADDSLKVSGIWVSPLEVEAALLEHPGVAECAVVGKADDQGLIKPKAFVTLKGGAKPGDEMSAELKKHVKERIAPYKYPRWFEYVDDLPKTSTGKIQRFKLR